MGCCWNHGPEPESDTKALLAAVLLSMLVFMDGKSALLLEAASALVVANRGQELFEVVLTTIGSLSGKNQ